LGYFRRWDKVIFRRAISLLVAIVCLGAPASQLVLL
jgi:hypothetical protein